MLYPDKHEKRDLEADAMFKTAKINLHIFGIETVTQYNLIFWGNSHKYRTVFSDRDKLHDLFDKTRFLKNKIKHLSETCEN